MANKMIYNFVLLLVLTLSLTAFASAADVGIVSSLENSAGTGIAVYENDVPLVDAIPTVVIGQIHTFSYDLQNKVPDTTSTIQVVARLDNSLVSRYTTIISSDSKKTLNFEIAGLKCNSLHTITVQVNITGDVDSVPEDNSAKRTILVSCGGDASIAAPESVPTSNPVCGNGVKEGSEQCDDHNTNSGDGCSSQCRIENGLYCGDGKVTGNETCDLGDMNGVLCSAGYNAFCDYCSSSCLTKTLKGEYCGDGIVNFAYERCDDANTIDRDKCTNECKKPFEVTTEDFVPQVFECDSRVVYDDATEPGRISGDGQTLIERLNDYAFEGEQIQWKVLLMDKNGIEKVGDVYVTVNGNMEANCKLLHDNAFQFPGEKDSIVSVDDGIGIDPSCNARIDEEKITEFNPSTMAYYLCTLTVETCDSMQGESDINVEVTDIDGEVGEMAEMEHWFLNPTIELSVDGTIEFSNMRPGTSSYSNRVLVGNGAESGSGVMLDMFISGTDFYDSSNSGALCPTSNQLLLSNFRYYVTNGAYSSHSDPRSDSEGYTPIRYGIGFNDPKPFYNQNEILQAQKVGPYYTANVLAPGSEMSLIFRLNLPEGCNGDFDSGKIYFWGEAI